MHQPDAAAFIGVFEGRRRNGMPPAERDEGNRIAAAAERSARQPLPRIVGLQWQILFCEF
jgi:hypothetical protein